MSDRLHPSNYPQGYLSYLEFLKHSIHKRLEDFPNFIQVSLNDVSGGYICVQGSHKEVRGYYYGDAIKLNYDFSNVDNVINNFVDMWISLDNPEWLKSYQSFLRDGERWGFD